MLTRNGPHEACLHDRHILRIPIFHCENRAKRLAMAVEHSNCSERELGEFIAEFRSGLRLDSRSRQYGD